MRQNKRSPGISFRLLAEGYFKSIENGKRLIDDGQVLLRNGRYLGAINFFRLATEEIIKAHLLNQPVTYNEGELEKWKWLWHAFHSHLEKQKIILLEFHGKSFKDENEFNETAKIIHSTRIDSIYVKFDFDKERFLSPEESLKYYGDLKTIAAREFEYAMALFKYFTISGELTIDEIERIFIMQHEDNI